MLLRRLFAITIAGMITVASIGMNSITVHATDDGGLVFFSDAENAGTVITEPEEVYTTDESSWTEEPPVTEEIYTEEYATQEITTPEIPVEYVEETYSEVTTRSQRNSQLISESNEPEEISEENPEDLLGEMLEENPEELDPELELTEELDENIYSVKLYPGDGKLISEFELSEDICDWEYDTADGVLTLYAFGYVKSIKGFKYALVVPDGSKNFLGWYYDEAMTEKVDLEEGIAFEGDITLYAAFEDSEMVNEEEEIHLPDIEVRHDSEITPLPDEDIFNELMAGKEEIPEDEQMYEAENIEEEELLEDTLYAVNFYPGEGNLISEFKIGNDVSDWHYNASAGVMTLYVPESAGLLKDVEYSLDVADGSKDFKGWYYDEAITQKANLAEGIIVDKDVALFAAFDDSKTLQEEEIPLSDAQVIRDSETPQGTDLASADKTETNGEETIEKLTSSDLILPDGELKAEVMPESEDNAASEEEADFAEGISTVSFYPGEGTLISRFKISEDVSDWNYNATEGVMTLYVPESVDVLNGVEYTLDVVDESKAFKGWYYDEALTQKANLATGITVDKDVALFAAFDDSKTLQEETIEKLTSSDLILPEDELETDVIPAGEQETVVIPDGELKAEVMPESEDDAASEEEADFGEEIRTVSFYPGEGTLISRFKINEDVSDWNYNATEGVMTLYVPESVGVLNGVEYTLHMADESKAFKGWYYDEALTQKASLEEGIIVDKDVALYAAFGDNNSDLEKEIIPDSDIALADKTGADDAVMSDIVPETDDITDPDNELKPDVLPVTEADTASAEETDLDEAAHTIKFYPGEGTLISVFRISKDVSDWNYNATDGVMTLHVPESVDTLEGIEYALDVADGSKKFSGWYYDEAMTSKADLETGIIVDEDINLYAAFGDSFTTDEEKTAQDDATIEDIVPVDDVELKPDAISEFESSGDSDDSLEKEDETEPEQEEEKNTVRSIKFHPGEGTLISEFKMEGNVYDWEYDATEGVMTIYISDDIDVLKGIDYALEVSNGSRIFTGWYYDEALTKKADFDEGISLDKEISLYAGFEDSAGNEIAVPDIVISNPSSEAEQSIIDEPFGEEAYDDNLKPDSDEPVQEEVIDPVYEEIEVVPQYDIDERDEAIFANVDIASSKLKISEIQPKNYTGEAVTYTEDEIRVYYNGIRLHEGEDYKLSYAHNTNTFIAPDNFGSLDDSDKTALKAPSVKVSLIGNYTGSATLYFDIKGMDISEAYLASSGVMTARYLDKAFDQYPVIKAELPDGKSIKLTIDKDYEVFYNRITNSDSAENINYSEELSAAQVAEIVRNANAAGNGEDLFFLVNVRGKGNFSGVLASEAGTNWAPKLQILSKASVEASFLQLDNANLSKKVPAQEYREDNTGSPLSASADVIKLFMDGDIVVSISGQKLTYVEDEAAASTITEEGYYFKAVDPATGDDELNRRVGTNNYVTLVATDIPEYNKLAGAFNVFFEIKGTKLAVKSINTSIDYDGHTVLVYSDDDSDKDGYLDVDVKASVERLNAVVIDSNNQVLSSDRYILSTDYDTSEAGRVIITFEGKADRGTTGRVTKKIRIEKRKLTEDDVKVNFADRNMSPEGVPLSGGMAEPGIIVRLNDSGDVLLENRDYTVTYDDNTDVGEIGSISVKFVGNYSGRLDNVLYFRVAKMYLSKDNIEVTAEDKVYKENAGANYFKSKPILSTEGNELKLKADYVYAAAPTYYYAENLTEKNASGKVIYSKKAGTPIEDDEVVHAGALIEVRFSVIPSSRTDNYTAEKDSRGNYIPVEFSATYRMGKMSIESAAVTIKDQEYDNGYSVIPDKDDITVTIGSGSNAVTLGRNDYLIIDAVSCEEVGTATLVIQGRGRYVGTKEVHYRIVKGRGEIS